MVLKLQHTKAQLQHTVLGDLFNERSTVSNTKVLTVNMSKPGIYCLTGALATEGLHYGPPYQIIEE